MALPVEFIFSACMGFALFGWAALALAPVRRDTCIAFARGVALVLAVAYLAQLAFNLVEVPGGSFWTIGGIATLFSAPENAMLGWTHYLAFDLFIGSWEAEDAVVSGVPHWALVLCLIGTLMVGPIGLLVYFIIRTISRRTVSA
jgi:Domain of unknown function (DUF4281)